MTTKTDIYMLSREEPILHTVLSQYELGEIEWEEALLKIIVLLVKKNKRMEELAIDVINNSARPIQVGDYET